MTGAASFGAPLPIGCSGGRSQAGLELMRCQHIQKNIRLTAVRRLEQLTAADAC